MRRPSTRPSLRHCPLACPSRGRSFIGQLDGKFAGRMQDAPPKNDLPFLTILLVRNYIWLREREDGGEPICDRGSIATPLIRKLQDDTSLW